MRRLSFFVTGLVALIALMGLNATAWADHDPGIVHDPECEGGAPAEIRGFSMEVTPGNSEMAYMVAGISGSGLACGTETFVDPKGGQGGADTLYERADIKVARGVTVNPTINPDGTDNIPQGAYVGKAEVDAIAFIGALPVLIDPGPGIGLASDLFVDNESIGTNCPADAIACYKGESRDAGGTLIGFNWNWVVLDSVTGRYTLTIGPFGNGLSPGDPAGLTEIEEFTLCARAGEAGFPPNEGVCGSDSDPWLQRNGDSPFQVLRDDTIFGFGEKGVYSVTATQFGGTITEPVTDRVWWQCNLRARPGSRCLR